MRMPIPTGVGKVLLRRRARIRKSRVQDTRHEFQAPVVVVVYDGRPRRKAHRYRRLLADNGLGGLDQSLDKLRGGDRARALQKCLRGSGEGTLHPRRHAGQHDGERVFARGARGLGLDVVVNEIVQVGEGDRAGSGLLFAALALVPGVHG